MNVAYPELYSTDKIYNKMNEYFTEYFSTHKLCDSVYDGVTIMKGASFSELDESVRIKAIFDQHIDSSINIEKIKSEWKDYVHKFFGGNIKHVFVEIMTFQEHSDDFNKQMEALEKLKNMWK